MIEPKRKIRRKEEREKERGRDGLLYTGGRTESHARRLASKQTIMSTMEIGKARVRKSA